MKTITLSGNVNQLLQLTTGTLKISPNDFSTMVSHIGGHLQGIQEAFANKKFEVKERSSTSVTMTISDNPSGQLTVQGPSLGNGLPKIRSFEFDPTSSGEPNWRLTGRGFDNLEKIGMRSITSAEIWNDTLTHRYLFKGNLIIGDNNQVKGKINSLTVSYGSSTLELMGTVDVNAPDKGTIKQMTLSDASGARITAVGAFPLALLMAQDHPDQSIADLLQDETILAGNDTLIVGGANRVWFGYAGNDKITGGDQGDTLDGGIGNDKLVGLAGNDYLFAGAGNDFLDGGDGNDSLFGNNGNDRLLGGKGNDSLKGEGGDDLIEGGEGNDTMEGGAGNDRILDLAGNNQISEDGGNNSITTGAGNDSIYSGTGNDVIRAGDGNNLISDSGGRSRITTGAGDDIIITYSGDENDVIQAGAGNDHIYSGGGQDKVDAGAGDDFVDATLAKGSIISGGRGDDRLTLSTVATAATANGVSGFETLLLSGHDMSQDMRVFKRNLSFSTLATSEFAASFTNVGAGITNYFASMSGEGVSISRLADTSSNALTIVVSSGSTLGNVTTNDEETITVKSSGTGNITLTQFNANDLEHLKITGAGKVTIQSLTAASGSSAGSLSIDGASNTGGVTLHVLGTNHNAEVIGSATAASELSGGSGNDTLQGGAAADTLNGGQGADILAGGAGADVLTGGTGTDIFRFAHGTSAYTGGIPGAAGAFDTITDYALGTDIIEFTGIALALPAEAPDTASEGVAGIAAATGLASFADTDDTLQERVHAVHASLADGGAATGEFAIFAFGGDTYVFVYEGLDAKLNELDGLIKLSGVTGVTGVDLSTSGSHLILS